ncbi:histidine phosphatase family protein [Oceaniglobus ichthyenteri]|uniref:histidine phosphatase family protein n=1 Tax=Oceaniglobus ichthyenteri TaxID=2136177 RepID=UPI000D36742C|nr:histidine phosphatase family protein [Oceaniglobus ichthyenteri]
MVEITLVRHGQANAAATDEAGYDNLSDLGRQQAVWLGEHLQDLGARYDHMICGTLNRQRDTAAEIAPRIDMGFTEDPRLNELDYYGLATSLRDDHSIAMPQDRDEFLHHMPQLMTAWEAGRLHSNLESFADFEGRVRAIIAHAETLGGRVMLVTSGGLIGMAMRVLLRLEVASYANVLLQINNTSVHRYVKGGNSLLLDTFNSLPHLERADRAHARTHI